MYNNKMLAITDSFTDGVCFNALTACSSTTRFFRRGAAPFLTSFPDRRHHRCIFLSSNPVKYPRRLAVFSDKTTETGSRLGKHFFCNCTQNITAPAPATLDLDQNALKEAANSLDIRVGRILKAWRHEEAESLYVEEVDVGEPEPRIICSGLVKYAPLDLLQDRNVIVLANLKPRNMRGVKSSGMLMAASDAAHENVELLAPPEGAVPGERVWFGSADEKENLPEVATPNQVQKKKIWESVQPHLKTDESCVAALGNHQMRTSGGVVVCKSLAKANIS